RGYAAINIFGLAVGFALCLLIVQFAAYQLSVGDFHEKKDRVFRVLSRVQLPYTDGVMVALGPALEEQLPEVEEAVRFSGGRRNLLRVGAKDGIREEVIWAEAGVLDVFGFPLLRGDLKTALTRPYTMVLTEPLARRLFGDNDPIGQVVRYEESFDCEVTGIVAQPPSSSLLQFSALVSFASMYEEMREFMATGSNRGFTTFVQLTPGADAAAVTARIPGIAETIKRQPRAADFYSLQPLKAIYFDTEVPNRYGPKGNSVYLALSAVLAVVVLMIAGVNYVNLATARAGRRMHEIGVRKALGAHRGQLMRQLLSESMLLSAGAIVLGAVLTEVLTLLLPVIAGSDFALPQLDWTISTYAGAAALAVGVGLIAGAYPAWVVARFQPATVVQGGRVGGARLRQSLVVAQFTVTAALLTMTLLMWHQIDYIQDLRREGSALEFEPEQVVVVEKGGMTVDQARAFKTELLQDSRIAAVSLAQTVPGEAMGYSSGVKAEGVEEYVMMRVYGVDGDFVESMGLQMSQGRALTDEPTDAQAIVINETAVQMLGWTEPLGKMINFMGQDRRVVGVIEDFHFEGPHQKIGPLLMRPISEQWWMTVIIVRVQPGHLDAGLKVIDDQWADIAPYRPIQRNSLEEVFAQLYSKELLMGRVLTLFLFLAIVVASVGLFGMAAYAAHERTQEIGIRKVFGASPGGLTAMLLRDFAKPVAIAF
ncbi:MAG: ABC transporter permease, partial [Gammaproteobacteria bacterium]|nr:ABC transporter permease [Gammaproteobacteria bacterium]